MSPTSYTEDALVQQTTADYFRDELGWESVYAYNNERFGPDSLLGCNSDRGLFLPRLMSREVSVQPIYAEHQK